MRKVAVSWLSISGLEAITAGCRRWRSNSCAWPVNVLVSVGGEPTALVAKAATSTIPTVTIVGTDPVGLGLAGSDSRPGGNITGVNIATGLVETKRLGLLRELVPQATSIGVLLNPANPALAIGQAKDIEQAAQAVKLPLHVLRASTEREINAAFDTIAQQRISGLLVGADPFFTEHADRIIALAARHAVPAMYQFRQFAQAGGACELWHPATRRLSSGGRLCRAYPQGGCGR